MKKLIALFLAVSFQTQAQDADLAKVGALMQANFAAISQNMVEACPTHFAIKNKSQHDADLKTFKKLQAEGKTMSASDQKESKGKMAKDCDGVNKQGQEKNGLKNIVYKQKL